MHGFSLVIYLLAYERDVPFAHVSAGGLGRGQRRPPCALRPELDLEALTSCSCLTLEPVEKCVYDTRGGILGGTRLKYVRCALCVSVWAVAPLPAPRSAFRFLLTIYLERPRAVGRDLEPTLYRSLHRCPAVSNEAVLRATD